MNHLPFREWLLSEDRLSQEQQQAFQEHLKGCQSCQAAQSSWNEVHSLMRRTPLMLPSNGFGERWRAHLAAHYEQRQRKKIGLAIIIGTLAVIILIAMLGTSLSTFVQSPTQFLLMVVAQMASFFVLFSSVQDYLTIFFNSFPLLPMIGSVLAVGLLSLLSVLWLTAYQQLVIARRYAK